ncbi:MAG TPA: helix-turn-helix domain-containing protein [Pyrinomonadaceae bacterium]|nr:helix-turn-helix domain-containing protein [Pyrinomonadaceae bacterium]
MKGYSTTAQTAERLGISTARVRQLIIEGVIKAEKIGRDNFIAEREVLRLEQTERRPGRPPIIKKAVGGNPGGN